MHPKQTLYLRLEGVSGVLRVEVAPLARLLGNSAAQGAMSARVHSCTTVKCSPLELHCARSAERTKTLTEAVHAVGKKSQEVHRGDVR